MQYTVSITYNFPYISTNEMLNLDSFEQQPYSHSEYLTIESFLNQGYPYYNNDLTFEIYDPMGTSSLIDLLNETKPLTYKTKRNHEKLTMAGYDYWSETGQKPITPEQNEELTEHEFHLSILTYAIDSSLEDASEVGVPVTYRDILKHTKQNLRSLDLLDTVVSV